MAIAVLCDHFTCIERTGQVVGWLVDVGVSFQEESDHGQVSTLCCQVTRRLPLMCQSVHIGATAMGRVCC